MTPYEQAMQVYETEPCVRTFAEDLLLHLKNGYVFSTPDYFVMGKLVPRTADDADLRNPSVSWPESECDAWYVYLFAGCMRAALVNLPVRREHVGFHRSLGRPLRFYRLNHLISKL